MYNRYSMHEPWIGESYEPLKSEVYNDVLSLYISRTCSDPNKECAYGDDAKTKDYHPFMPLSASRYDRWSIVNEFLNDDRNCDHIMIENPVNHRKFRVNDFLYQLLISNDIVIFKFCLNIHRDDESDWTHFVQSPAEHYNIRHFEILNMVRSLMRKTIKLN